MARKCAATGVGAALLALAAPAMAEDDGNRSWPSGLPSAIMQGDFDTYDINALARLDFGPIRLGDMDIVFEETLLADLVAAFGGHMRARETAYDSYIELCYGLADRSVIWLVSALEQGDGKVNVIALESGPALPDWDCVDLDAIVDAGVPGLGASTKAVNEFFGPALLGEPDFIIYEHLSGDRETPSVRTAIYASDLYTVSAIVWSQISF